MQIGFSSIIGDGFGTGSFVISTISGGISYPPAGSYNSTLYATQYEVGSTITVLSVSYYNQICDVIVKNDGAGGTYIDWTSATNIGYASDGQFIVTSTSEPHSSSPVTIWGNTYYTANASGYTYQHNGTGGYKTIDAGETVIDPNTLYNDYTNSGSTAEYYLLYLFGSGYQKGKYTNFYAYGIGNVGYTDNNGSYQSYGTYITSDPDMGNPYYWDGNGGYYMG